MFRRRRARDLAITNDEILGIVSMVMRIDAWATRILEILLEEHGWEEED